MTNEKILEVISIYEERYRTDLAGPVMGHINTMFPQMREFVKEGRREKVFRWLGFVQGVLWITGIYSIDELKNHNRPDNDNLNLSKL